MHDVTQLKETPYETIARLIDPLIKKFDDDGNIPSYIFGDVLTKNAKVRPLDPDAEDPNIQGMDAVLKTYRQFAPTVQQSGPTSLGPLIDEAIKSCERSPEFHILIAITDGDITEPDQDKIKIQKASGYPLSIVVVGVGDGPFDILEQFDSKLSGRKFDNFNFFNYSEYKHKIDFMDTGSQNTAEEMVALQMLQEIPDQYQDIKTLQLLK
ncbi:Copine_I [Hexamita inflata]|nr:Copine I [Hexamita inflata]